MRNPPSFPLPATRPCHPHLSPSPSPSPSPFSSPSLPLRLSVPRLRWVVWMAGPGDGVTVGGFPRCEADFIVERNTRCVISRDSLFLLLLSSSVSLSLPESTVESWWKKKVGSCGKCKTNRTEGHVAIESGPFSLPRNRSRCRANARTDGPCMYYYHTSRRCIRLVSAKGADNYLRSSRFVRYPAYARLFGL